MNKDYLVGWLIFTIAGAVSFAALWSGKAGRNRVWERATREGEPIRYWLQVGLYIGSTGYGLFLMLTNR